MSCWARASYLSLSYLRSFPFDKIKIDRTAIFFVGLRRLLALSETLALRYPIKKWAALFAIAGAIFHDIATGSRVGTERALL
jgi:hypothetical protein